MTWSRFRFRLQAQKISPAMAAKSKSPTPAPIPAMAPVPIFFLAGVAVIRMGVVVGIGFKLLVEVESVVEPVEERLAEVGVGIVTDCPRVLPMAV